MTRLLRHEFSTQTMYEKVTNETVPIPQEAHVNSDS
jgi:hypothetical protein